MNDISLVNQTGKDINEMLTLENLITYAVSYENLNNVIFTVVFINDDEMQKLNKLYRNIDHTTDVLSFAFEDTKYYISSEVRMLGEIYISIDRAHDQALSYGHAYLRELSFLMIHGFLHLLGYDHMESEDELKMFARQEEILNGFGIKK